MLLDLVNESLDYQGLAPQTLTASAQGASNDFSNGENSLNMVVDIGTITTANVTSLVVQAEESSTGTGSWTVIPGMVVTVTATTTAANLHQKVRGLRSKQYARVNAITFSVTTTTGAFPISADLFSQKKQQPQSGGFSLSPTAAG
jgi:hypothetical protein